MQRAGDTSPHFVDELKARVDADLEAFFTKETERALELSGDATLVHELRELTMRGGKRLRPAVLYAAFRALDDAGTIATVLPACTALELLQSYLLVHDDWMDGDDVRRGGPSVHASLRKKAGDAHLGDALAILAGDLGCAYAWERFLDTDAAAERRVAALRVFAAIQREVVLGQELDVKGSPDVTRMQQLKTGSYTVAGPIRLGALLGGAKEGDAAWKALDAFAMPLGEAFQIRDDLLGTFGDPEKTGKSAGNDLRAGKRTALVRAAEERLDFHALGPLRKVLGRATADDDEIAIARDLFVTSGVKAHVEGRLAALLAEAKAALDVPALASTGRAMLTDLAERIAARVS